MILGWGYAMKRSIVVLFLVSYTWGSIANSRHAAPEPNYDWVIGPGTVTLVSLLHLPFSVRYVKVIYVTDDGRKFEIWDSGGEIKVIEGMHGILEYATNPERIIRFRVQPR